MVIAVSFEYNEQVCWSWGSPIVIARRIFWLLIRPFVIAGMVVVWFLCGIMTLKKLQLMAVFVSWCTSPCHLSRTQGQTSLSSQPLHPTLPINSFRSREPGTLIPVPLWNRLVWRGGGESLPDARALLSKVGCCGLPFEIASLHFISSFCPFSSSSSSSSSSSPSSSSSLLRVSFALSPFTKLNATLMIIPNHTILSTCNMSSRPQEY